MKILTLEKFRLYGKFQVIFGSIAIMLLNWLSVQYPLSYCFEHLCYYKIFMLSQNFYVITWMNNLEENTFQPATLK